MHRHLSALRRASVLALLCLFAVVSPGRAAVPPSFVNLWGGPLPGNANGQFNDPAGVAVDAAGNVYVADTGNDRVQKFTANGTYLMQWGGTGSGPGQFNGPFGIAVDGGNVYVVDTFNQRVQKFSLNGAFLGQWGTLGTGPGQFQQPLCVAVDAAGGVYVTDYNLNRVQKFTTGGAFVLQWGSTGTGPSQFNGCSGVCVDGFGDVLVTDSGSHRIEVFDTSGNFTSTWGTGPSAAPGYFNDPLGIATDGIDAFVADGLNHRIQWLNTFGSFLTQWGTGPATGNGQFNDPHGLAMNANFVYVADTENNRIQRFAVFQPEQCANCAPIGDPCCEALPTVGGPWSNILVTTRDENPYPPYPYAVTIFDLNATPLPAEGVDWASMTRYNGPGGSWTKAALGTVFGLTLDEYGNIFVCHTSCYPGDAIGTIAGAAPGAIYRIDAATGAMNTFCVLPNALDPSIMTPSEAYPGLGNITYDCTHKQFFVTDLEDGKIYRIKPNGVNGPTGSVVQTFDPLAPDNGLPGFAPIGERLWGIQWHRDRVFYSVWAVDPTGGTGPNEIRSVALLPSGAINGPSDQHELFLPPQPGFAWSTPVADISFSSTGKMLLGERGISQKTEPYTHHSRVLEYACSGGCWIPANQYRTGVYDQQTNAEGGVDYDPQAFSGPASSIGRVWATVDAMHFSPPHPDYVYGWQGLRPNLAFGSYLTSLLVDADGLTNALDKTYIGDVEAPGCPAGGAGSICGHKYSDQNRNGTPDGPEPGLSGWTITLNGPGGPYTTVTDVNGAFCFTGLAAGAYTLSEVQQPGWVETAPSGNSYAIALGAGQNLTGYDFGNFSCSLGGPVGGCVAPPPAMIAWWPFNESLASTTAKDATHLSPARNVATLYGGAAISNGGEVGRALCFSAEGDYARVPIGNQIGTNWGASPFAIDVWVNPQSSAAPSRMIVEKRTKISSGPYRTAGWALYMNGQQLFLEIGNSVNTVSYPGPTIGASVWSHVAVSVDRSPAAGRWYVNGVVQPAFNFVPLAGSVANSADIWMGQVSPPFGAALGFQGCIDELEILSTPTPPVSVLPAATVAAIFAAGAAGKCPETILMPDVTTICKNDTSVKVCFTVCNSSATSQSYHWSAAALPAGPGCTVAGPVSFSPPAGTLTLAPGACSTPICVIMPRPAGLTAQNATACFSITLTNDANGACQVRNGTIRADNTCWCITPASSDPVAIPGRLAPGIAGIPVVIGIKNPCGPPTAIPYRVSASWLHPELGDPLEVSLNGLPPGEPVIGTIQFDPGTTEQDLTVLVSYPGGYDGFAPYEIVLEADTDGDGVMERQAGTIVVSTYDDQETVSAPVAPGFAESVKLSLRPNPFTGSSAIEFTLARGVDVTLGVYDLLGREVKTLHRGALAAGPHRFDWNGRDEGGRRSPAGVYFVRWQAPGRSMETKVVKLR